AGGETMVGGAIVSVDPPKAMLRKINRGGLRASRGAGDVQKGVGVFLHSKGEISLQYTLDEGDYVIRFKAFGRQAGDEPVRMTLRVNFKDLGTFDVKNEAAMPGVFEVKTRLK